jgi:hypothetical protein
MRRIGIVVSLVVLPGVVIAALDAASSDRVMRLSLSATVAATGIPGAGAVAQVGVFHKGGPFAAAFAPFTQAGRVLDRTRPFAPSARAIRCCICCTGGVKTKRAGTGRGMWTTSSTT